MVIKSYGIFYPSMQCMAKVSEMYIRHRGTARLHTVLYVEREQPNKGTRIAMSFLFQSFITAYCAYCFIYIQ